MGLAIEDMVRDVEAANDLFPDEPCGEHEPCGEDDDCGGPLSGCDLPCFQEGRDTCPACAAGTQEAFGRRQLVLKGVDKGDLVCDNLLPSGKNTILDVGITCPLVDTAASKYEAKKDMDYDAVIGTCRHDRRPPDRLPPPPVWSHHVDFAAVAAALCCPLAGLPAAWAVVAHP